MNKYFLIFLLFFLFLNYQALCQDNESNEIKIYDCDSIFNDIALKGEKSIYYNQIDYSFFSLDRNIIFTLLKIDSNYLKDNGIDTLSIFSEKPKEQIKDISVNLNNIKELFLSNKKCKSIILQLKDENIKNENDFKIYHAYVNDNKAVFTINMESFNCTITYKVILLNRCMLRFEVINFMQYEPLIDLND